MWGFSSLDEIAKAASEQLNNGVIGPVSTPSSFFNLDSMMQEQESEGQENKSNHGNQNASAIKGESSMDVVKNLGNQFNTAWQSTPVASTSSGVNYFSVNKQKSNTKSKNLSSIDVDILLNTKAPPKPKPKPEPILSAEQDFINADDSKPKNDAISPSPKGMWGSIMSENTEASEIHRSEGFGTLHNSDGANSGDRIPNDTVESNQLGINRQTGEMISSVERISLNDASSKLISEKDDATKRIDETVAELSIVIEAESNIDNMPSSSTASDDGMISELNTLEGISKEISEECNENSSEDKVCIDKNSNNVEINTANTAPNKNVDENFVIESHGCDNDELSLGEASKDDKVNISDDKSNLIFNRDRLQTEKASPANDKSEYFESSGEAHHAELSLSSDAHNASTSEGEGTKGCIYESSQALNGNGPINKADIEDSNRAQILLEKIEALISQHELELREIQLQYEEKLKESEYNRKSQVKNLENDNSILRRQIESIGSKIATMEKRAQLHQSESTYSRKHVEEAAGTIDALKTALSTAQEEHATLNQQYDALKERVQSVAIDLKARRIECRDLTAKNLDLAKESSDNEAKLYDLLAENNQLKSRNMILEEENKVLSVDKGGHSDEVMKLQSLSVELENKVQELRSSLEASEAKAKAASNKVATLERSLDTEIKAAKLGNEDALTSYKKKAQTALASANARAAAAIEAREEAEIEAARAHELVENAKHSYQNFSLLENQIKSELDSSKSKVMELEGIVLEKDSLLGSFETDLLGMKEAFALIQDEKGTLKSKLSVVEREHDQLKQRFAETEKALKKEMNAISKLRQRIEDNEGVLRTTSTDNANSSSTIERLRSELEEANYDIDELKDALKSALLQKQALEETQKVSSLSGEKHTVPPQVTRQNTDNATPLFYAMEKQAELVAARDEISRLASLLGDTNQEKEEALAEANEAWNKLEETEAMLLRQVKMGKRRPNHGNIMNIEQDNRESSYEHMSKVDSTADINLEYLKNVMMKYLSAKSCNERRSLIPAISAVLCLTRDETQQALNSVDLSAGIGNALIDSISMFRKPT